MSTHMHFELRTNLLRAASFLILLCYVCAGYAQVPKKPGAGRERISVNNGWRFMRYKNTAGNLNHDDRPKILGTRKNAS
jgi:hypothetical protein